MDLLSYMATHADDLLEATAEHLMLLGATMRTRAARNAGLHARGREGMMDLLSYMATHADDLLEATAEHLMLLGATMLISCAIAALITVATMFISCAIAALITVACLRSRPLGNAVVEVLGAAYAIPSLALFALLIPLTGLGFTSAVIVMVVYNQFMLVRKALEGIRGVDPALIEAARGMGLSDSLVLLKVQLPLSLPAIIAGLRLACISTIPVSHCSPCSSL